MSGTYLVFAGHRSAYKCIQQCHVSYFYKNVIKSRNMQSAMQYCTSMKKENVHLAKIKDFKFEDIVNSLNANIGLRKQQNINEATNDVYNKKKTNRFISNKLTKNILISKKLERLYQQPKNSLFEIYKIVCQELNDQTLLTSSYNQDRKSQLWEFTYDIKWPETMSFKAVSNRKIAASKTAAFKCLKWLEANHKLKNGKPILYNQEQIKDLQLNTHELSVAPEVLDSMESLIETYKMKVNIPKLDDSTTNSFNIRTAVPNYCAFGLSDRNVTNIKHRNWVLQTRLAERSVHTDLPIFEFRDKILSMLDENRVLLIEGDTGCGKSTQVPQFILDSYARKGNVVNCNILVSQPRRIAAISLANRVAHERGEIVGDVIGYQVRLENETPQEFGRILYCSTGILLKKLQRTPDLKGCSHVILDEAHERNVDTDLLLLLLKKTLDLNPNLKLLIMSATINTHLFQEYLNCPTVKVPGRMYPVEMNFLEDIENLPNFDKHEPYSYQSRHKDNRNILISVDTIKLVQIIKWISANKPHGAILCFLPGWSEILQIQRMLEDEPLATQKQLVLTVHSKETYDAQRTIFQEVPEGTRKIILATNIAETGITVPDVCYVVDSAICRVVQWDDTKDTMCVNNEWITKANIQQRKGRAGRVKPGISYHMIEKAEYDKLREYPIADILSTSLEKTIMDCKSYTNEKAEIFLSGLMEPPTLNRIQKGVDYLINIGVLDKEENLTALGERMTVFSTHPRFSKALVYSTIFNCIHPIVTIASVFSNEESGFSSILSEKAENRKNKVLYHPSSDHIATAWIFKTWHVSYFENIRTAMRFCAEMNLRYPKMKTLSMLRNLFLQQLILCRLLDSNMQKFNNSDVVDDIIDHDVTANKYEDKDELVQAVLYSATQQLIEHKNVGFKKGILKKGINELRVGNIKAIIAGDSVNYKRDVWPSSYLTYFRGEHNNMRQRMIIRDTSIISPLTVLLFNQQKIQCLERDDKTEIKIEVNKKHTLNFSCDKRTADIILKFRDIMWSVVQYSLENQGFEYDNYGSRLISEYKDQLLETLVKALEASSECIGNTKDDYDDDKDKDSK